MNQQQQRGGKLLGQGLYGCAFSPPLICKKNIKTKGIVGKITSIDDASTEYSVSMLLKENPYAEEYFIIMEDICSPKPRANQKEKDISSCKPLDNVRLPDVRQIIMPFGGKPLGQITNTINPQNFYMIGQHLLEAGTLLLLSGIVHSDLHALNVLVSDNKPKLIDFGLAWMPGRLTLSNVYLLERVFAPHITQQTPECTVMSGLQEDYKYSHIIASIADNKTVLTLIYKLTGRTIESQLQELEKFMRSSICFRERDWYSFYKIYWSKIDSWAFGCLLLTSFVNMLYNSPNEQQEQGNTTTMTCILGLCSMDPGKRLDAAEALEIFAPDSKILKLPNVQAWLKEKTALRKDLIQKIGVQ